MFNFSCRIRIGFVGSLDVVLSFFFVKVVKIIHQKNVNCQAAAIPKAVRYIF
jgi:hypothetical protein